jgi:tRNA A-37 threonylcarbamoyl transferase component Bud32
VRRLVQQEDYALSLMQRAGLPSPAPFGFVELTPEREYLLVTEFFAGATELGEAEIDDQVIDDGLGIIRKLWDAGLAHRDIKPANLLVREGRMLLIDVAFVEARPTPGRQAVDLANMMLCLALRCGPERVYRRALEFFTVEEISEGFAAARGLALPSQLRHMLRAQGRDLHAEFIRLLPTPPQPIRVQRWSARRIGLWAVILALVVLAVVNPKFLFNNEEAVETPLMVNDVGCRDVGAVGVAGPVCGVPPGRLDAGEGDRQRRPLGAHPQPRPCRRCRPGHAADRRMRPDRSGGGAVVDTGRAAAPADRVACRRVQRHLV